MKNVTIYDANINALNLEVLNGTIVADLCESDEVQEFFDIYDAEELKAAFEKLNGEQIPSFLRSTILGALVEPGATYHFGLESAEEKHYYEDEDEESDTPPVAPVVPEEDRDIPRRGMVMVETSAGLQSTNVAIDVGVTTVHEAIYNDAVRARSGMTDAQLSSCVIMMGEDEVSQEEAHERVLNSGELISLNIRVASKGGNC